ncbi:MAG: anti-sigma factor family protein [Pirellula sp.]
MSSKEIESMDDGSMDEALTAYLDGELPAAEATLLEQRLVDEPAMRKRLATLRQAYDMLDELPETPQSNSFTQTTMELVLADVKKSMQTSGSIRSENRPKAASEPARRSSWFQWPRLLATVGTMLMLGTALGTAAAFLQMRIELSLLGLFSNSPGLQDVSEISVVQELAKDKPVIDYLRERYADRSIPLVPNSLWQRKIWFRSLNATQIAKLDTGKEMILKLPMETRFRLEAIQTQIDESPDAADLNHTIRMVGTVLDSMPNTKRQDLDGMTAEQRVRFLREQLYLRAAMLYSADITPEDTAAIEDWSKNQLLPVLIASMPFLRRETDVRTMLMALYSQRPVEDGFRLNEQDELVAELIKVLPPFAKKLLEGIHRNDQLNVISTWLVPDGINNNARMLEAYDRLRREVREEIDLADPAASKRMILDRSRRVGPANRNR